MGRMEKRICSDARNPEKQILMIRFLQNPDIDRVAWDNCINNSRQGLIYGMSWYLDLVSPDWCGLEEDGYKTVMPLPVKKKYRIPYIIQPLYTQQLGVFSENPVSPEKISEFLYNIPAQFKFIALGLNFMNKIVAEDIPVRLNINFELNLNRDYPSIEAAYSANTRRNIQKAGELNISFDGTLDDLIRLKIENTGAGRRRVSPQLIKEFVSAVMKRGNGFICSASLGNNTCAAVFFLQHKKRIYYLIPVSSPLGKEKKAMFAIIDLIIQKFAGSSLILDFEGSNIPGLSRFFAGFGAINVPYTSLVVNHLPFPLNQFRKS
jgi:hypothetical protein